MFRTVPLSNIRSFSLYTQQWCMSYRFVGRLRAGSGRNQFRLSDYWSTEVRYQPEAHIFQFTSHPKWFWGPSNLSFNGDKELFFPDVKQQWRKTHKTLHVVLKLGESRTAAPIQLLSSRYGVRSRRQTNSSEF